MIARLTLTMGERHVVARLDHDGQWSCEDLLIESFLNAVFCPEPADPKAIPATHTQIARRAASAVEDAGWYVRCEILQADQNAA
jgi:hypothetical protein